MKKSDVTATFLLRAVAVGLIGFFLIVSSQVAYAQAKPNTAELVTVGQPAGDFKFSSILNYTKVSGSLADFRGKLIILDFWSTTCSPCIDHMRDMLEVKNRFRDKVEILVVAGDDRSEVERFYKQRPELKMPTVFGLDSVFVPLKDRFGAPALGTYVWIDTNGIVRGITGAEAVTIENVESVLEGKSVALPLLGGVGTPKREYSYKELFMIGNNTGGVKEISYISLVTPPMPGTGPGQRGCGGNSRCILYVNYPILWLLEAAINNQGKLTSRARIMYEGSDTASLKSRVTSSSDVYCYQLMVPQDRKDNLPSIMHREIEQAFGITARFEPRVVRALALVKVGQGPRIAVGGDYPKVKPLTFMHWNSPVKELAERLESYLKVPVLDETKLDMKIDIVWDDLYRKGLASVRKELQKNGLDLQEVKRDIDMLVIREL